MAGGRDIAFRRGFTFSLYQLLHDEEIRSSTENLSSTSLLPTGEHPPRTVSSATLSLQHAGIFLHWAEKFPTKHEHTPPPASQPWGTRIVGSGGYPQTPGGVEKC